MKGQQSIVSLWLTHLMWEGAKGMSSPLRLGAGRKQGMLLDLNLENEL